MTLTHTPNPVPVAIPVDEVLARFEADDREAVHSFLVADPVLLFPLRESVPEIESVFGANTRIALEPVVDPETADRPVLCVLIQLFDTSVEAALAKFRRGWWYTARPRPGETLLFDVEACTTNDLAHPIGPTPRRRVSALCQP